MPLTVRLLTSQYKAEVQGLGSETRVASSCTHQVALGEACAGSAAALAALAP